ncbi:MAG: DNA-3-methyladenine glycosylase 2 family protein [Burkholderiaceae bacterium]|nr:DNA-3-methyladenine glycosylase 2 family protein [Burkholderiaceae bacterium]
MKPEFWDRACRELSACDPVLGRVIDAHAGEHLVARDDPFLTLVRSIVGQQISVKAAQSVWDRLARRSRTVTPERLSRMRTTTMRDCGLSQRKAEYVQDLARHFVNGTVDPSHWASLDDEAVIAELTSVRGIGRWTAEMFLIFNLQRPDVLPLDDIGLLRGMGHGYKGGERVSRAEAEAIAQAWRPWRSVATWFLWRSLDPLPVEY